MGQQQLLLIILGLIIVAVAISMGIYLFNTTGISSNKDNLVTGMGDVASDAFAYFQRAKIMGGGNGSYLGYVVPPAYSSNANGDVVATIASDGLSVTFVGTSRNGYGTVTAQLDNKGNLGSWVFTGEFQ